MTLSINGRKYVWKFLVADVTQPLLGADFLCSNSLMVDVKGQRLVDPTTYTSLPFYLSQRHQLMGSTMLLKTMTFLLSLKNFQTF